MHSHTSRIRIADWWTTCYDRLERASNEGIVPEKGVMLRSHQDTYSWVMTTGVSGN